ncbi:lysophospholipid acyltransferase family protein [Anaerolineales bacterium HSG6]|nr:lysophospholipid acyltransferase family protein [Anaerolineales bacterium HSG6]
MMTQTDPPADWRDQYRWFTHLPLFSQAVRAGGIAIGHAIITLETIDYENMPSTEPCIVACNHVSAFDPQFIGLYLPRYPHFMAKDSLYKTPFLRWVFRMAGSFPVERKQRDVWALRQAGRVLKAGRVLFMFPEGTRSRNQAKLQEGKVGAVKLALEYQVPIVPAMIFGSQNMRFGLRNVNRVKMQLAPPLNISEHIGSPPYQQEQLRAGTTIVMHRIAAMLPPENRGFYA